MFNTLTFTGYSDGDYDAVSDQIIQFNVGDRIQTHTIVINDDSLCENETETLFSTISVGDSTEQFVHITQPQAAIVIDDSEEAECGRFSAIMLLYILII